MKRRSAIRSAPFWSAMPRKRGCNTASIFFDDGMSFMRQKHSFFSNGMKKEPGSTPGSCPFSKMKERQRRQARRACLFLVVPVCAGKADKVLSNSANCAIIQVLYNSIKVVKGYNGTGVPFFSFYAGIVEQHTGAHSMRAPLQGALIFYRARGRKRHGIDRHRR